VDYSLLGLPIRGSEQTLTAARPSRIFTAFPFLRYLEANAWRPIAERCISERANTGSLSGGPASVKAKKEEISPGEDLGPEVGGTSGVCKRRSPGGLVAHLETPSTWLCYALN